MEAEKIFLKEFLGLSHFVFLYLEEREREGERRGEGKRSLLVATGCVPVSDYELLQLHASTASRNPPTSALAVVVRTLE